MGVGELSLSPSQPDTRNLRHFDTGPLRRFPGLGSTNQLADAQYQGTDSQGWKGRLSSFSRILLVLIYRCDCHLYSLELGPLPTSPIGFKFSSGTLAHSFTPEKQSRLKIFYKHHYCDQARTRTSSFNPSNIRIKL